MKKIKQSMILNMEIKKIAEKLDLNELKEAYVESYKNLRAYHISTYQNFYEAIKEIQYPEYDNLKREDINWYPQIDYKKCINCKECINFCPKGVYTLKNDTVIVEYPYSCVINCTGCVSHACNFGAISFPKKIKKTIDI
ncbi:4Fe-4S dicluster domain-containing protein [Methanococcus voltae]|uniref:NAD-dependent dihydropyrimidine dehydrogenase PreA subunit n=1 Tax=Methanococcus voltae PS TaxID=523842 RepID=A0ABT2EXP0_METVO|nr:ferredoxin family protein [Methanococcus voltae]MBP2171737.1 NAD-dependent dihydropyrimidine dehydrogenase PreA subunit [Methanococcus voltae]MCS3922733.1 NAD-dependent dihydropyrimidine dehydrogenase PreA subunit [Methanococcus voltae PS]